MRRLNTFGPNILLIAAVAAIFFVGGLALGHYDVPPSITLRYWNQNMPFNGLVNSFITRLRKDDKLTDVVMLGDSITEFGDWAALLERPNVLNLGISGDTSAGVLNRLHQVISRRPRIVFVMIGINDFFDDIPVDLTEYHIQLIASLLVKNRIEPVIQSTLLVREYPEVNSKIRALNDDLRVWCAERKFTFVDLNEVLSLNGVLRADVTDDGIHLNKNGYVLWRDVIRRYI